MELLYKKIINIVEEEAACLDEFLRLLIDQQRFLVENDLTNLKQGVEKQQLTIDKIKALEKMRGQIVAKYSESESVSPADVTISSLARKAGGEMAEKLLDLQKSLLSLHQKIEKAKRKNEFLIEHSMKYIDGTIRLIAQQGNANKDYSRRDEQKSLIVSKTV